MSPWEKKRREHHMTGTQRFGLTLMPLALILCTPDILRMWLMSTISDRSFSGRKYWYTSQRSRHRELSPVPESQDGGFAPLQWKTHQSRAQHKAPDLGISLQQLPVHRVCLYSLEAHTSSWTAFVSTGQSSITQTLPGTGGVYAGTCLHIYRGFL